MSEAGVEKTTTAAVRPPKRIGSAASANRPAADC
jgi:hypothetical protein